MEQKKRMFVALAIALVIATAVLSSFFLPLVFGTTPEIHLPDVSDLTESNEPGGQQEPDGGNYVRVDVTPETVQNVISTLERPVSYYRALTVETIWGEGASDRSTAELQVWMDGGFTKVETRTPGGLVQHCIVGSGKLYLWYGTDKTCYEAKADELSADLAQRMPTYEDLLKIDTNSITDTRYEIWNGSSCIYIEVSDDTLGYLERYWVEVQSGLLVAAETAKDGMVVYRMTSKTVEFPIPQDASFALPDGTVLHQVLKT